VAACHLHPDQAFSLIPGYSAHYIHTDSDLNAPAGNVDKPGSTVPTGEVFIITGLAATNVMRAGRNIMGYTNGTSYAVLHDSTQPGVGLWSLWHGWQVIPTGFYPWFRFHGVVALDDLYWRSWGFKMVVTQ
jgi:hypothetical protein